MLVYEFIAFCMVVYKANTFLRGRRLLDTLLAESDQHASNLVVVLFRDSIGYFAV